MMQKIKAYRVCVIMPGVFPPRKKGTLARCNSVVFFVMQIIEQRRELHIAYLVIAMMMIGMLDALSSYNYLLIQTSVLLWNFKTSSEISTALANVALYLVTNCIPLFYANQARATCKTTVVAGAKTIAQLRSKFLNLHVQIAHSI